MSYLGLFEGYGIELEYMIVDKTTLEILPITDLVMKNFAGEIVSDFEDGDVTWSNELVLHVLELKTTGPAPTLDDRESSFNRSIKKINAMLAEKNACLMPTAMHPFMHPSEMKLWPHDNNEIYALYDKIFDCRGHGWSNLQSMHINLPFKTDKEFDVLHTAIRFLLPILPALAASSPVVEGKLTGNSDSRLLFYQQNQKRVPSIAGQVIPEAVTSMADYHDKILSRIYKDITPHDPDEMMREDWLNSRGAIARFERQTIEIRVLDLQETPLFDFAIADLVSTLLKSLVSGQLVPLETQRAMPTEDLKSLFDRAAHQAESAMIQNSAYASAWNMSDKSSLQDLWKSIHSRLTAKQFMSTAHYEISKKIISSGSLATRIKNSLGQNPSPEKIRETYSSLCRCLAENKMFGATT